MRYTLSVAVMVKVAAPVVVWVLLRSPGSTLLPYPALFRSVVVAKVTAPIAFSVARAVL